MALPAHTKASPTGRLDDDRGFAIRLMEHLVVPTFVIDRHSQVLVWNKACERLTGIAADEVLNTREHWRAFYAKRRPCLADLLAEGNYQAIGTYYSNWDGFGLSDFGVSVENWCLMPRLGRKLYLAIDAGPIYDEAGSLIAVVETLRDITAQQETQRALETLAAKDALTGLANRRSFDDTLAAVVRRGKRDRQPVSLLMIDVDCFKSFNDRYGHQSGDACLRAVAKAISAALRRAGDMAARYGGEEFAVILPNTDAAGAARTAERIRQAVERLGIAHAASSAGARVTLSLGSSTAVDLDAERLVESADEALYASKRNGRNRCTASEAGQAFELF